MSSYSTGSVTIRVGSAQVTGNNTGFSGNVSVGNYFKITGENAWYTVADVVNATNLTLTSRYANSAYQTATLETLGTATTATKMYSGTFGNTPVIQNYVKITIGSEAFIDNGAGVLSGNASPAGSGTIGYDDGAYSVTLGTDLTATVSIVASYYYGQTRNALPYQIITDYTTNYSIPEMSLNDIDFAAIYTKAMRIVDEQINNATAHRGIAFFYKGSLSVGSDLLSGLVPNTTRCNKVYAQVDTAASGCSIILDIRKNKSTILNATKLVISAGSTDASCVPKVATVESWDSISVCVNQVGSSVAGGNDLRVTARFTA